MSRMQAAIYGNIFSTYGDDSLPQKLLDIRIPVTKRTVIYIK